MAALLLLMTYVMFGFCLLVAWPVFLHPRWTNRRKLVLCFMMFMLTLFMTWALYTYVGVPKIAAN